MAMEYMVSSEVPLVKVSLCILYSSTRETFCSRTSKETLYFIAIKVPLVKIFCGYFIVQPEKPFAVGLV